VLEQRLKCLPHQHAEHLWQIILPVDFGLSLIEIMNVGSIFQIDILMITNVTHSMTTWSDIM
jgi:hypothetical protein